jgi:hypothetical protein
MLFGSAYPRGRAMSVSCRRVIALTVLLKAFLNGTSSGGCEMRGIYTLHLTVAVRQMITNAK